MNDHYNVTQTLDGQKYIRHEDDADLGVDGVLYIVMILIEVIIILINVTDVGIVATSVVRPLVNSTRRSSTYASTSTLTSRTSITSKVSGRGSFLSLRKVSLLKRQRTTSFTKDTTQGDRDNTLSKTLLYTDLTSVSYRKPLLSALVLIDAILSSLYVVPNSNVFTWAAPTSVCSACGSSC
ncbi:hypothetical protein Poli38472_007304 [Pythium oligandrum]|uniref:Uncharacterized protein n=1 Tax=Pythium oligandrum TaxID=41045 RepID=A0A8K1FFN0_PYTOL|nr:hypothetical protein Poli38472_007304 [Pythium oligandrum]|eukprot:TMW59159.1 hypothetical protein Poli38472_007304 [Pythium oligandrum]